MIITDSQLNLSSQRQALSEHIQRERLNINRGQGDGNSTTQMRQAGISSQSVEITVSEQQTNVRIATQTQPPNALPLPAQQAMPRPQENNLTLSSEAQSLQPQRRSAEIEEEGDATVKSKLSALVSFVEQLTGKKMKLFNGNELQDPSDDSRNNANIPRGPQGVRVEYDYYERRLEEEHTTFSANGTVKTADGKEINIDVELNMSRRFMEEQNISVRIGEEPRLKDPLVINFDGNAAELSSSKFQFDIDSDGREDQISLLSSNSGFLALDKNGDGTINNGGELFGATSGNGFEDLAAYDEDGNRWIDEADSIYSKLRIWSPDENGESELIALGSKDVGAIYLGNANTQFNLNDIDTNQMNGQVASSGIFLKDSGGAGTVQQINLVV